MGQKYCVKHNSHTSEHNEFVNLLIIGLQAKMTVISGLNIFPS